MIPTDSLIDAAGCPIAVRDFGGRGPDVLLLHGKGRNLVDWMPIAERLSADHHVVAMDLRGHGASGDAGWTLEAVLGDIAHVIRAMSLDGPVLVGHSLGGLLAALYEQRHGGVAGVVNIDGYGNGTVDQYVGLDPVDVQAFLDGVRERVRVLGAEPDAVHSRAELPRVIDESLLVARRLGVPDSLERAATSRSVQDLGDGTFLLHPRGYRIEEMSQATDPLSWLEVLAQVSSPLLLVRCEDYGQLPAATAAFKRAYSRGLRRDLAELSALPQVTVRFLPAHHLCLSTMPDELADELRRFIAADPASPASAS